MTTTRPLVVATPAELDAAVGVELGPGPWFVVDQDRIDTFAAASGDHQWIHVDPARAAAGPHGTTIAHGQLTLSLISSLAGDLYRLELGSARLNYGMDRVRFPAPVPSGSRVRLRATIASTEPRTGGVLVAIDVTVELEDSRRPACVARKLSLLLLD
ncbi:Acyl dehydratase [Pseudonocardia ammonioxydans]|uniref:Acyl dehydratase n=1 Tax=Pseudonocardia ammonioxydans TaxID=260086 RepID=A0A1I5AR73_PSUAM|nr:MaoC family dehydratase [Pseudonocardia ammonioxydans]SFN64945.1 Acyl dehydratase [Pseudonocardia ammonioxydans]